MIVLGGKTFSGSWASGVWTVMTISCFQNILIESSKIEYTSDSCIAVQFKTTHDNNSNFTALLVYSYFGVVEVLDIRLGTTRDAPLQHLLYLGHQVDILMRKRHGKYALKDKKYNFMEKLHNVKFY